MLDLTNINIVVLLFVLIVSGNFIAELLPCRIQYRMQNDMKLKHFIGFLTLSFFVILSLVSNKLIRCPSQLVNTPFGPLDILRDLLF